MIFMLGAGLIISLIPVQYTATATLSVHPKAGYLSEDLASIRSDAQILEDIKATEVPKILNQSVVDSLIRRYDLTNREEFNIAADEDRALTDKIFDRINAFLFPQNRQSDLPIDKRIYRSIQNDLKTEITTGNLVKIHYTNYSPHLAKALANHIAQAYISEHTPNFVKKIEQKAKLPKEISVPNISFSLSSAAITGLILSVFLCLYLHPVSQRKREVDHAKQYSKL